MTRWRRVVPLVDALACTRQIREERRKTAAATAEEKTDEEKFSPFFFVREKRKKCARAKNAAVRPLSLCCCLLVGYFLIMNCVTQSNNKTVVGWGKQQVEPRPIVDRQPTDHIRGHCD